ncbi:hypothetical protein Trydic_g11021 [Trypoxylus dichotomus]
MIQNWCLSKQLMELNTNMASLELNEEVGSTQSVENSDPKQDLRRSSRLRKKINLPVEGVHTRNKNPSKNSNKTSIEQYYLSKQVKRLPSTLETIYEEPKALNNEVQYMSIKKFKRILNFDEDNIMGYKKRRRKSARSQSSETARVLISPSYEKASQHLMSFQCKFERPKIWT